MDTSAEKKTGWLALVATPIGNLEDITLRAIRILKEADLLAAEDTRRALILCKTYGLTAELMPYHAHNEHRRTAGILAAVEAGKKVAVLSDAGTPTISDPGFFIVRAALSRGLKPVIIPGVSALTFAVVAAGLPVDRFAFHGFVPVKEGRRRSFLEAIKASGMTCFVFESPHRATRLLEAIVAVIGPLTRVALVREATKLHEECLRGTAAELLARHGTRNWKGEFVVAIDATPKGLAGAPVDALESGAGEPAADEDASQGPADVDAGAAAEAAVEVDCEGAGTTTK